ncbi:MAG: DUF1854 domain-containing protein [Isosphaeraceae bacterium]
MKIEPFPSNRFSDGENVDLRLDNFGRLEVTTPEGHRHLEVDPIRAFPLSEPSRWISFCDRDGREVFFLRSTEGMSQDSRQILERELSLREFMPRIKRIIRVSNEGTPAEWEVETDRGRVSFTLDSEDDLRHLPPHRVLITDARKLRYQIPDRNKLDGHSRRLLDRFS